VWTNEEITQNLWEMSLNAKVVRIILQLVSQDFREGVVIWDLIFVSIWGLILCVTMCSLACNRWKS